VRHRLLVTALLVAAGAPASAAAIHAGEQHHPWRPHLDAARTFVEHRSGEVAYAVATRHRLWGYRETVQFHSASVVKAMLLVAYLRQHAADRALRGDERAMLEPMIQRSGNDAADWGYARVGDRGLSSLAARVGMRRFSPGGSIWGYSLIDARDQALFFLRIDRWLPHRHRAYGMHLLASVVPSQRWGVGRVRPPGWRLYFKGGWGSGSGLVDHQVALLRRGGRRVAVAVLTRNDPDHEYGKRTLQGVFGRVLRSLSRSRFVP
jgi:Beta-lactamase enzyme family